MRKPPINTNLQSVLLMDCLPGCLARIGGHATEYMTEAEQSREVSNSTNEVLIARARPAI